MNNKNKNHQATGKSDCKSQDINYNVGFVTENIPKSSLKKIAKHNSIPGF